MAQPSQGNPTPGILGTPPGVAQIVNAEGVPLTGYVPVWGAGGFATWAAQTASGGSGLGLTPTAVKTSNYNAAAADLVPVDISAGSFTVTLPTAPAANTLVAVEVVNRVTTGAPFFATVATGGADTLFRPGGPVSGLLGRGTLLLQYSGGVWFSPAGGDFLPVGFEFGYDQITAPVTIASTTEASGTTVLTAAAHTFDGGPVMVEFFSYFSSYSAATITVCLFEGATEITRLLAAASAGFTPLTGRYRFSPTAGSHTYTVTAFKTGGTGSVEAGVAGTAAGSPAFLRFTKV